jgi:hypothetical protein
MAVALLLFASPWLAYARSFYSEVIAGLLFTTALFLYLASSPSLAAATIGLALWVKPQYGLIGAAWVAELLLRRRYRQSLAMIAIVGAAASALLLFNQYGARRWLVGGNFGFQFGNPIAGFYATLAGSHYGLLAYAPWALIGACGAAWVLTRRALSEQASDRLLIAVAPGLLLNLIMLSLLGFSPATCWGPRYWVPLLPWLALASVATIARLPATARIVAVMLAIASVPIALGGALRYDSLWDTPSWRAISSYF